MQLDHIVHYVERTPQQMTEHALTQGFHAVMGGKHAQWGTANALHFLASSYIEWLSLEDETVARNAEHPLTQLLLHDRPAGPGFLTICLRPDDMEELNSQLNRQGIETTGVLHASRQTPDGQTLRWKMLFIKEDITNELPLPFFIEWGQSQEDKYADLANAGQIAANVFYQQVETLTLHTAHPEETAKRWGELFGGEVRGHELVLENTRLVFEASTHEKKRLHQIDIKGTGVENTIEMEGALYRLLP